jgi:O-antigen/teichoic acid export membrane protein
LSEIEVESAPGEGRSLAATPEAVAAPAIQGSLWTMGGYAVGQLLRLGSNLVLTRLLFPAVFGEMALVFIFIQGLQMFSDVGTGPAIIQNARGDQRSFLDTAWTIQSVRGVVLWLASWVIAWPVAAFYGHPMLRWLIPAAAVTAVFGGFESTAMHTLQRHLRLERLTILELGTQLLGIVVNVILAVLDRRFYGPNDPNAVWAIIGGSLVSSAARLALSHTWLPGIRHRFHLDREAMRHLFGFGRWIFVSTVLTFLAGQSDRLIFGKMVPIALFGVYSVASMLSALPTQAVVKLGGAVVFPAYSRLVERDDFAKVFWRVRWPLLLGGAAIVSALLASGPFLVRVLYDRRYAEAGWILQYLSAAAWFQILECTNGAALLAKGRVKWVAAGSAAKVAGMVVAIPLGYRLGGFHGALAGLVVSEMLKYVTAAVGAAAAGLRGLGRDSVLTAAVAATSLVGFGLGRIADARASGALVGLVASAAAGGAVWVGAALLHLRREKAARGGGWTAQTSG